MKKNLIIVAFSMAAILPSTIFARYTKVNIGENNRIEAQKVAQDVGKLESVEDAGYPIVVLTIELQDGTAKAYNLDLQEVGGLQQSTLEAWIGKKVVINYEAIAENNLEELIFNNKSLINDAVMPRRSGSKKIVGRLSAQEVTKSDLPDMTHIITEEEITYSFPFFITEEMVAQNGKIVTAYYSERTVNEVKSVKLAGNTVTSKDIPYTKASNYFVKNSYTGTQNGLIISTKKDLEDIFGYGATMGSKPVDFSTHFVVAFIGASTNKETSFVVKNFTAGNPKNNLVYDIVVGKQQTYTSRPHLLIAVERKYLKDITFTKAGSK